MRGKPVQFSANFCNFLKFSASNNLPVKNTILQFSARNFLQRIFPNPYSKHTLPQRAHNLAIFKLETHSDRISSLNWISLNKPAPVW